MLSDSEWLVGTDYLVLLTEARFMKAVISVILAIVAMAGAVVLQGSEQDPATKATAEGRLPSGLSSVEGASYRSVEGLAAGSKEAQDRQREAVEATGLPLEVECKLTGMRFRLIPAGEFVLGGDMSPSEIVSHYGGREEWYTNEGPQRTVRITKPFYMGIYEVTQAQYQAVMGGNPSLFKGNDLPVERVSWEDATEFCRRMSQLTGLTIALPTEAQWEYACRAGTTTPFYFGSNANQLGEYAWYSDNSGRKTHPVGQRRPNAWCLYDMHGNVWEWCADWYEDSYSGPAAVDPQGPQSGADRVRRGGSWNGNDRSCRSASRRWGYPGRTDNNLGLRVVVSGGLDFRLMSVKDVCPESRRLRMQ